MTDRDVARQRLQLLFAEDVSNEPHVAHDREATGVRDGDSRRLLAAMLERVEAEVGKPRDVALVRADPEDAAHQSSASQARRSSSTGTPRTSEPPTTPIRRAATDEPVGSTST